MALPSDLASRPAQAWMARGNVSGKAEDGEEQRVRTTFLAWSAKHFSSKRMKLEEDMVAMESGEYWAKQWLYERNEKILLRGILWMKEVAGWMISWGW